MRYIILTLCLVTILSGCKPLKEPVGKFVITETMDNAEDNFNFAISSNAPDTRDWDSIYRPAPVCVVKPADPIPPQVMTDYKRPALKLAATKPKLKATVYTKDDCPHCVATEKRWGAGNNRIEIEYKKEAPKKGPVDFYPMVRWLDVNGNTRWPTDKNGTQIGPVGMSLDDLADLIERNNRPKTKFKVRRVYNSGIMFGIPYYELSTGRTSVQHLIHEHGLTWQQLAPYANNQDALDRIHGWKHTGRGTPAPSINIQAEEEVDEEEVYEAVASGGAVEGVQGTVTKFIEWIRTNVGEDVAMRMEWDRSGASKFPLLRGGDWSALRLYGKSGHILLSADQSVFPINAIGFGYKLDGKDVIFELDPVRIKDLATTVTPMSTHEVVMSSSQNGKVGMDPATILTIFSVLKGIWSLLHPEADLTLGGNVALIAKLHGDKLTISFSDDCPRIALKMLFTFDLGVKTVEINPTSARMVFIGSRFIKERTFKITPIQGENHDCYACGTGVSHRISARGGMHHWTAVLPHHNTPDPRTVQRLDHYCVEGPRSPRVDWAAVKLRRVSYREVPIVV